jgi:uncharacterized membrane protein
MSVELHTVLVAAAFLSTLLAGLLITFAILVMPGLGRLDDRAFLLAFREIDGIIQRGHPAFGLIWLGSGLALVAAVALAFLQRADLDLLLLLAALVIHVLGVQLPTLRVNVPLNNQLQALKLENLDEEAYRAARGRFEGRWNRWNRVRTVLAIAAAALLWAVVLLR